MPRTTAISRFTIHDELSAPERSVPVLKGAGAGSGQLPNIFGVLAGAPAALRGYVRLRGELRHGVLPASTRERLSLAVAAHFGAPSEVAMHARTARQAGLGMDEIALAKEFSSRDEREAALLRYVGHLLRERSRPAEVVHEEAREIGWTEEEILEAIAHASSEVFAALTGLAGDVPADGSHEQSRLLEAA